MQDKKFERNARLEGEIRSVLSDVLHLEVKDPRLDGVTISGITLNADRTRAAIYFSVIGSDERERQAADGFVAAASFMRRRLGQKMRLRVVPALEFERDTSYEYGDRMERIFERLADDGLLPDAPAENGGEDS